MGIPSSILGLFPVLWDRYGPLVWPGSRCEGQCPPGLAPRIPSLVMGKLGMIQLLPGVGNADTSQPQSSFLGKPLIVKKIIKKSSLFLFSRHGPCCSFLVDSTSVQRPLLQEQTSCQIPSSLTSAAPETTSSVPGARAASGPRSASRLTDGTCYVCDGINPYRPPLPSLCVGEEVMQRWCHLGHLNVTGRVKMLWRRR